MLQDSERYPDKTSDDKTYYVKTATTKHTLNKTDTRQNRHDKTDMRQNRHATKPTCFKLHVNLIAIVCDCFKQFRPPDARDCALTYV